MFGALSLELYIIHMRLLQPMVEIVFGRIGDDDNCNIVGLCI